MQNAEHIQINHLHPQAMMRCGMPKGNVSLRWQQIHTNSLKLIREFPANNGC